MAITAITNHPNPSDLAKTDFGRLRNDPLKGGRVGEKFLCGNSARKTIAFPKKESTEKWP